VDKVVKTVGSKLLLDGIVSFVRSKAPAIWGLEKDQEDFLYNNVILALY